ncbi:MAG: hypothetical protein EB127_31920 [Alphaproteobacteria bacterium]|jgi:hypothetical protein|nr:hypothetical protein [Alphaproteobacteria bacterium]
MDYEQTLSKVARELRGFAAKEIHMNYEEGPEWAEDIGGGMFGQAYQEIYKKYFGERITPTIHEKILVAGRSVGYLMFSLYESDTDIDDMVRIVTSFITSQVTYTNEWCEDFQGD